MRGFTLMELLVVVFIMSVLLALSMPALGVFRANSLQKEKARDVLAAFRLARNNAINHNLEYQVVFDIDAQRYWLEKGNLSSGSTTWTKVKDLGGFNAQAHIATGKECTNLSGEGIGVADDKIQFNPNGTSGCSGTAMSPYICILDEHGVNQFHVAVPSSVTSRPVIMKPE
ncbi:pilus assembly FimT family protein [Vibrio sp.]|uniref:pilus assembly FimT family protein n=1 Tax=Vibrio sp. TaxID=678 RepID=UPI003D0BA351